MKTNVFLALLLIGVSTAVFAQSVNQRWMTTHKDLSKNSVAKSTNEKFLTVSGSIENPMLPPKRNVQKQTVLQGKEGSIFKPDSILIDDSIAITQEYDGSGRHIFTYKKEKKGNIWETTAQQTMYYDDFGNMTGHLYEEWDGTAFVSQYMESKTFYDNGLLKSVELSENYQGTFTKTYLYLYEYDNAGNMTSYVTQNWNDNKWVNALMHTMVYQNNLEVSGSSAIWQNEQWREINRYYNVYDSKGNLLTETSEYWYDGTWNNSSRSNYTYDERGNTLTYITEKYENGAWKNVNKFVYTYNSLSKLETGLASVWANGTWAQQYRYNFTYTSRGELEDYIYESWLGFGWGNKQRFHREYDASGNLNLSLYQKFIDNDWKNEMKTMYVYDGMGNAIHGSSYYWFENTWTPAENQVDMSYNNGEDIFSTYATVINMHYLQISGNEPIANREKSFTLQQNYPNPFNPQTVISYTLAKESHVIAKVYNILGHEIRTLINEQQKAGEYKMAFNGTNLASGVYILRFEADGFTAHQKMNLIK